MPFKDTEDRPDSEQVGCALTAEQNCMLLMTTSCPSTSISTVFAGTLRCLLGLRGTRVCVKFWARHRALL